jgi:hypothetical protein
MRSISPRVATAFKKGQAFITACYFEDPPYSSLDWEPRGIPPGLPELLPLDFPVLPLLLVPLVPPLLLLPLPCVPMPEQAASKDIVKTAIANVFISVLLSLPQTQLPPKKNSQFSI